MKDKKDLISDIDLIIGRNNEITDDTHMDLVDEVVEYINQLLPTQSDNQICHICNGQGSIKRIDKDSTSLYETCPECHGNLISTPPTEDKVVDVHVIMEQMYKEFEYNVGKPKLVHVGKPTHMWEQMFKSSVKHALLQIAKNQFAQLQPSKDQFLKGIEYAIRHFDIKDPEALLKKAQNQ